MNNKQFFKTFFFTQHDFGQFHHTNNQDGLPFHYIARMKRGKSKFVYNHNIIQFHQGDIFYIPRKLPYQSYWYGDDNNTVVFDSLGFGFFPDNSEKKYVIQKLNFDISQKTLLDKITENYNVNCENIGTLYLLLSSILDSLKYETYTSSDNVIAKAREFMQCNDIYTIKDVAEYCNVSEATLYNTFKKICGHTPIDEKHIILVDHAIELLESTNISITNIISNLGFSSEPYFRKIFYNITGKTPRQIRKERQQLL